MLGSVFPKEFPYQNYFDTFDYYKIYSKNVWICKSPLNFLPSGIPGIGVTNFRD